MRNIIGPSVTGDDFFDREKELKTIYELLKQNISVLIPGPRRIGKSSLVLEFQQRYKKEFKIIYLNLQGCDSIVEFYEDILRELETIWAKYEKAKKQAKDFWNTLSSMIQELKVIIVNIKIGKISSNQIKELKKLDNYFIKLAKANFVLIFDEFPDFLLNLKKNNEDYTNLLQRIRTYRQPNKVLMIITGSINLISTAEELMVAHLINDLRDIDIEPLDNDQIKDLIEKLLIGKKIEISSDAWDFIYEKTKDGIPFYIKLFVDAILNSLPYGSSKIKKIIIDHNEIQNIYERIINRRHKEFVDFHSRLDKFIPSKPENKAFKTILSNLSFDDMNFEDIYPYVEKFVSKEEAMKIIKRLTDECYIHIQGSRYKFVSPMLSDWWKIMYSYER